MDKDKRLMEVSLWERLTEGETGSCSDGPCSVNLWSNFLLLGETVFPPCCLTWGQSMVEVMKTMGLLQQVLCTTATLRAPDPAPGYHWYTPMLDTSGHSWASLGPSLVGPLLLSSGSWCTQGFVCSLQESVSPVLCKFWQATADLYLHRRHLNTQSQVWLSLCGVSWCTQGFVWVLWASLTGMGFDSKFSFTLPTVFLGFTFALGCGLYFFGGIQHSVDGCSVASYHFGVLTGKDDKRMSF